MQLGVENLEWSLLNAWGLATRRLPQWSGNAQVGLSFLFQGLKEEEAVSNTFREQMGEEQLHISVDSKYILWSKYSAKLMLQRFSGKLWVSKGVCLAIQQGYKRQKWDKMLKFQILGCLFSSWAVLSYINLEIDKFLTLNL